jgi:aminomethyltransferase
MAVSDNDYLKRTPLYDLHLELGARMVAFAGYSMPVQYEGVKAEHLHTRAGAGLFDVSHMGQIIVRGADAALKLETLVPVDLVDLPVNRQSYALFTNDRGGIRDDLMICRWDADCFLLVVNAACKAADMVWLRENLAGLDIDLLEAQALLALQGPAAVEVLAALLPDVRSLAFMHGCHADLEDIPLYITRSGYTGEDGFELSLPAHQAEGLARRLLVHDAVKPVGLGARDTLRLEAGLCLYGHDLDETTTPVSAGLAWSISKARRSGGVRAGGFPGADTVLQEMTLGTLERRAGLQVNGKAPVREGAQLVDEHSKLIGHVSSGGFGPSVNAPIAMGYLQSAYTEPGTEIDAIVRGRPLKVTVTTLPFVPSRYVR